MIRGTVHLCGSAIIVLLFLAVVPASAVRTTKGLAGGTVLALAVDPSAPQTAYAGTEHGIFKSTNGGTFWLSSSYGVLDPYVIALAVDPTNHGIVYAGTSKKVYKSTNGGRRWSPAGLRHYRGRNNDLA
jgi:hypothetical protein